MAMPPLPVDLLQAEKTPEEKMNRGDAARTAKAAAGGDKWSWAVLIKAVWRPDQH